MAPPGVYNHLVPSPSSGRRYSMPIRISRPDLPEVDDYSFKSKSPAKIPTQKTLKSTEMVSQDYKNRFQRYKNEDVLIVNKEYWEGNILKLYLEKMKIICPDDTNIPCNRKERNVTTKVCCNGQDALSFVKKENKTFGIIIIEYMLGPESPSGREIIRELRHHGYKGAIVYVLNISNFPSDKEQLKQHLLEVGADAMLIKGSEAMKNELKKMIRQLVLFSCPQEDP